MQLLLHNFHGSKIRLTSRTQVYLYHKSLAGGASNQVPSRKVSPVQNPPYFTDLIVFFITVGASDSSLKPSLHSSESAVLRGLTIVFFLAERASKDSLKSRLPSYSLALLTHHSSLTS
ncbi:hypothetical protein TNCV_4722701 [Trichonephila clavipes]|uniref:Uncharacterized protein n=1 Tax=Trichonephila clavipes TaxID=2585209 RepID=A0A8X6W6Y2_TRICX|nr:hypothetical protein TNCV_4722701 [Trichonephila clavipes]